MFMISSNCQEKKKVELESQKKKILTFNIKNKFDIAKKIDAYVYPFSFDIMN
mgnify:CR=1 FL=1